jgi:hypothetical protein
VADLIVFVYSTIEFFVMADVKTKMNNASVERFIKSVKDEQKQKDSFVIVELMKKAVSDDPKMWGSSIIGFGQIHYIYASGREGDWPMLGFSPRKQSMTLYFCTGFKPFEPHLKKLGKFKTGKGCLYFNKLDDVDISVLRTILKETVKESKKKKMIFDTRNVS